MGINTKYILTSMGLSRSIDEGLLLPGRTNAFHPPGLMHPGRRASDLQEFQAFEEVFGSGAQGQCARKSDLAGNPIRIIEQMRAHSVTKK